MKKRICLLLALFIALSIAFAGDSGLYVVIAVKKSALPTLKEKIIDKLIEQRAFPDTQQWRDYIISGTQIYTNAAGAEWVIYVDSKEHMTDGIIGLTTNRVQEIKNYINGGSNIRFAVSRDPAGLIASYGLFPPPAPEAP